MAWLPILEDLAAIVAREEVLSLAEQEAARIAEAEFAKLAQVVSGMHAYAGPAARFDLGVSFDMQGHLPTYSEFLAALKANADEIGLIERTNVEGRTPVLTGALHDSIVYTTGSGKNLVTVYANDAEQLSSWHRVYAEYQEGPPLGTPTYTNPPRQMFARAVSEDLGDIKDWAERTLQGLVDSWSGF